MIEIRPEIPEDYAAVFEINSRAFETDSEAKLVDAVRAEGIPLVSLVAIFEGKIAGYILFTPLTIDRKSASGSLMGIGPFAVLPEFQKRGIGSKLILEGLDICKKTERRRCLFSDTPNTIPVSVSSWSRNTGCTIKSRNMINISSFVN